MKTDVGFSVPDFLTWDQGGFIKLVRIWFCRSSDSVSVEHLYLNIWFSVKPAAARLVFIISEQRRTRASSVWVSPSLPVISVLMVSSELFRTPWSNSLWPQWRCTSDLSVGYLTTDYQEWMCNHQLVFILYIVLKPFYVLNKTLWFVLLSKGAALINLSTVFGSAAHWVMVQLSCARL